MRAAQGQPAAVRGLAGGPGERGGARQPLRRVLPPQNIAANDQTFSPKWIADLEASFRGQQLHHGGRDHQHLRRLSRGADPPEPRERTIPVVIRYSGTTPFGINGRFVYGRVTYRF